MAAVASGLALMLKWLTVEASTTPWAPATAATSLAPTLEQDFTRWSLGRYSLDGRWQINGDWGPQDGRVVQSLASVTGVRMNLTCEANSNNGGEVQTRGLYSYGY